MTEGPTPRDFGCRQEKWVPKLYHFLHAAVSCPASPRAEHHMFSQTVEYALRAIVYLADSAGARTTTQIAAATKVPAPYLSKVLQNLARAGFVRSQRGLHGGITLAVTPEQVTIWDVVQCVDPIRRIRSCPLELDSHRTNLCPLHRRMDNALEMVEDALRASTLAEVLAEPTTSKPLCPVPQPMIIDGPKLRQPRKRD